MPFIANTPESLIGRSDSKNPSTTCRGITSSGRPCRRPLAASASSSAPSTPPFSTPPRRKGNQLRVDDDPADESLYCWQHKEQASLSARSSPGPRASHSPILEERTSIDTLADRLGLLDVSHHQKPPRKHGRVPSDAPPHLPPSAGGGPFSSSARPPPKMVMTRPKRKKKGSLSFCFCFTVPLEEVSRPPARPKPRPLQPTAEAAPTTPSSKAGRHQQQQHGGRPSDHRPGRSSLPSGMATLSPDGSPGRRHHASVTSLASPNTPGSATAQYMSLIPTSTVPQTASQLLAELAKPVSQLDDPGYIYMFWLTPESAPATPPADAARSLLVPPATPTRPGRSEQRRVSDVLASYASSVSDGTRGPSSRTRVGSSPAATASKTILLKIGRATNVQRRLNEWKRQCGYNLSLIRYYPYIPSPSPGGGSPGASGTIPRKVPHSHRVERLIHIELEGLGMRAEVRCCDACGSKHREWFEVDASRKGVEAVDEVIRRWVEWDEGRI